MRRPADIPNVEMLWHLSAVLLPLAFAAMRGDEAALAARLRRREPEALRDLYDLYGRVTYSVVLRVVRDEGAAQDVVQETFLRVWNRAHLLNEQCTAVGPWLLAVARNQAIDYLRAARRRPADQAEFSGLEDPALLANLETEVVHSDQVRRIREAIERLPASHRHVIELAYFEGLSQTEIAERIQQPLGTVKTWTRTALRSLREHMGSTGTA
jgi:RNA polymerase sigma-70 factor, ECF subfamily